MGERERASEQERVGESVCGRERERASRPSHSIIIFLSIFQVFIAAMSGSRREGNKARAAACAVQADHLHGLGVAGRDSSEDDFSAGSSGMENFCHSDPAKTPTNSCLNSLLPEWNLGTLHNKDPF